MPEQRSKFTRYRPGDSAPTITLSPSWLYIYDRSTTLLTGREVARINSGYADCVRRADVQPGDFLKDAVTNRVYQVVQISDRPASRRALIAEIMGLIPDDFDNTLNAFVETFWTLVEPGTSNFQSNGLLTQMQVVNGPSATTPRNGAYAYQTLTGDFDIWSKVGIDGGAIGAIRYAMIGARTFTGEGVCVGIKSNGTPNFIRNEFFGLNSVTETEAPAIATSKAGGLSGFVRLKRVGTTFYTYYSLSTTEPQTENEWEELVTTAEAVYDNGSVSVGMFGYCNASTAGTLSWDFIRNWKAS